MKVLAVNIYGDMTYCTCPPELRGKGRCNHIAHQNQGETPQEFCDRVSEMNFEKFANEPDFISTEGTEIELEEYRMTEEEKKTLIEVTSKFDLDASMPNGGYITFEEPLWNDMDKNVFAKMSGLKVKAIESVLHDESYIILESDNPRFPEGKILPKDAGEELTNKGIKLKFGSGVVGMNEYAKTFYNWEATRDQYVLPDYMRAGTDEVDGDINYSSEEKEEKKDYYTVTSDLNTNKAGTYTVTVKAYDKNGNESSSTYKIVVKQKVVRQQTTQPYTAKGTYNGPASIDTSSVVATARSLVGARYVYAGENPSTGFDCSGLALYSVYQGTGKSIDHYSQSQYDDAPKYPVSQRQPGDLVFFGSDSQSIHHVAIYVGNDEMVEAPGHNSDCSGIYVRKRDLRTSDLIQKVGRYW